MDRCQTNSPVLLAQCERVAGHKGLHYAEQDRLGEYVDAAWIDDAHIKWTDEWCDVPFGPESDLDWVEKRFLCRREPGHEGEHACAAALGAGYDASMDKDLPLPSAMKTLSVRAKGKSAAVAAMTHELPGVYPKQGMIAARGKSG